MNGEFLFKSPATPDAPALILFLDNGLRVTRMPVEEKIEAGFFTRRP